MFPSKVILSSVRRHFEERQKEKYFVTTKPEAAFIIKLKSDNNGKTLIIKSGGTLNQLRRGLICCLSHEAKSCSKFVEPTQSQL